MLPRLPVQAQLELTKRCNFGCDHCFASATENDTRHMVPETMRRALSQLMGAGVYWIQLSGGEPLLAPCFYEAVAMVMAGPAAQQLSILSNGSLWDEDTCTRIASLPVKNRASRLKVQISIDGHDSASFSAARSVDPGMFDVIRSNAERMLRGGLMTTGMFVVTSRTAPHALRTARFALSDLGMAYFAIVPLYIAGRAQDHYADLAFEFRAWSDTLREVSRIRQDSAWGTTSGKLTANVYNLYELILPLEDTDYLDTVWGYSDITAIERFRPHFCEAGYTDVFVSYDGRIYPCPPASDIDEFVAGDITEAGLEEIWKKSRVLNWFREVHYRVIRRPPCCDCRLARICGGGCRVAAYLQLGDPEAPDPRCPIVRTWRARNEE